MYGWMWRHLPGPAWLKVFFLIIIFGGIIAFLFLYGFEQIQDYMPFSNDSDVQVP